MKISGISTSNCKYGACDGSGIIILDNGTAKICECREDKILESRLRFASIPEEFRDLKVRDFELGGYTGKERDKAGLARKVAVNYIKQYDKFSETGKGLYLYSDTKGSGKTRLMASIANALLEHNKQSVKFITTIGLLDEIKATYSSKENNESELIEAITKVDVLALDDIGVESNTTWVEEKLYNILNDRMTSKRVTLFTSNTNIERLKLDERIKSRIEAMIFPVKMPEQSIRKLKSREQNAELSRMLFE